ncbi:hypothetical protein, conserved [Babesia bigemina]|uniref:RAP domain-containing protein n=1 Tax=Babesia bigemina TaxID=5866 RepID=A0A061DBD0_BABBI|nr:hypothetical protein, conserved [Babesia bigemina]CDR95050.1 hypothetical protein, conserved [Babesia bigemina]|eukprot:XP_012767236.1 hypothetical protein, conserved [Babesia bigemina]
MAMSLLDAPSPASDPIGVDVTPPCLAGYRVYKDHRSKNRFYRDFRRRKRDLTVVESRFGDVLRKDGKRQSKSPQRLLDAFFNQLGCIRPQLVEYLRRNPGLLVERLQRYFGVSVHLTAPDNDVVASSAFPDPRSAEAAAAAPDTAAGEAPCEGASVPCPESDIGKELLTSVLETLSQKYEIISSLESQVYELSRENTELSLKLSDAYSELLQLELDRSGSEQRYLDALTSLTESVYISATQCSNLQNLVIKRGKQLTAQAHSLFLAENALAQQCLLNNVPCPVLSKACSRFAYDASSLENSGSTAPNIARFTLNDADCATSAYDSDLQGSLYDEGPTSAGVPSGEKGLLSATSFYESGGDSARSRQDQQPSNEGELIIAEFDGNKAVSVCHFPDAPSALPVQTASPESGAATNDAPVVEGDLVRESHVEKLLLDVSTNPPREGVEQASSQVLPPVLGSPALDSVAATAVMPSEPANATLPSPAAAPVSGYSGDHVRDDAKVRELIAEISVIQKKSQSYVRHIRALKRENERLRSRARLPEDLRAEVSTGSAGPFDYRMSGDVASIGSAFYAAAGAGPSRVSPEEDTKVKELKAEISILQKQIQRSQEASEDRQRLQDQLAAEERRNRELYSELSVARRKLVTYHNELEQLLRSYGGGAQAAADANQSSTVVSQDYDRSSKLGATVSELKTVLMTLNGRVQSYESDNDALRSELDHLRSKLSAVHDELGHLRSQNQALFADTREAGCLAFDRLLHCLTDALGGMTRTSLEELEAAPSEQGTTTLSQLGTDDLTAERITVLEFENKLFSDKLSSLLDIVHQSSLERFQMHTTIARLNSDLHSSHQQLLKFSNQSSVLLDTSNELAALRARCATYDDQVNRLKQMNTDLSDLNNRLGDDLRNLEEKSACASNEVSALREEVRQLQSLLVGDTQAAHDAIRDRVSIIRLEGRCKFLDESVSNGRVELESLRGKNSDLVKSVMELRYALEQERASNAEYLKQVNAMSEAEGRLRNQLDRQETQIEGLRASVASLTESLQQNAADMRAASERLLEKERSESALSSTIDSLGASLNSLLSSVRDAKPIPLAPADLGPIDLSSIPNFNLTVYYGVLDTIQKSAMDSHDVTDIGATAKVVSLARDKVCNILKCNYLLGALASGLCRQLQEFSASLVAAARSQDCSVTPLVKCLGESVNLELLRADFANRMSRAHAHTKELKAIIRHLYKNNPADVINRLKDHYEDALGKCQVKIEQLSSVIKSKEEDQLKLKQENSKLMSDCSTAAHALNEFDKRLELQAQERSSLCAFALSLLPPAAQTDCEQDDLRGILAALRNVISKLASYRDKYKKLLDNPPEPKVVTVTVPAPAPAPQPEPKAAPAPGAAEPAEQRAAKAPGHTSDDGRGAGNYIPSSVGHGHGHGHGPGHPNPLRDHAVRRAAPSDVPLRLERALKDVDANVRYYVKNIKSTLRDYVRNLAATQADASETDYESPRTRSVGRSDVTVGNIGDFSDTESESSELLFSDKPAAEDIIRSHARQFESICDLLDHARDVQSQVMERPPRVVYVDTPKPAPVRPALASTSDMAVMHHFHHLCAALKEYVAGRPIALSVDDVFYQLELVMLDQGDRGRRRAKWDHCVGNMVSVVIDVLRSISLDRKESVDGLRRRCSVASAALEEAQALCRLREEELHRRTTELSEACSRLESLERHCRKVEVELETLSAEVPRVNERDVRALESSLANREEDVRRLSKEVSKLHSVVFDLEEVNELLSQQLSRAKTDSERLGATVDKQQREISSLNSELALLERRTGRGARYAVWQPAFNVNMFLVRTNFAPYACRVAARRRFLSSGCPSGAAEAGHSDSCELGELRSACTSAPAAGAALSLDDLRQVTSRFRRLHRKGVVDAELCEKYSALLMSYADNAAGAAALSLDECFELFVSQCETNSSRQISLLASRLLDVIKANDAGSSLPVALKALVRLQRAKISYPELLDYVSGHVSALSPPQLADFAWACYSGGLRSKHHLDVAYGECLRRLSEFDLAELLRVLRSFSYFSYEYRAVFEQSQPALRGELGKLSQEDLLMLLNVCKTLHREGDFVELRDGILGHLMDDLGQYPTRFLLQCLAHLTRGRRTQVGGRFVSHVLRNEAECAREYARMTVPALVSVMQCLELWRTRMSHLTVILRLLGERVRELAFSRNLGLWAEVYNVVYSTGWFSPEFMRAGVEHIIAEPQILHRVSCHQVVRVLQTFYKLRYYHRGSYERMLGVFLEDFDGVSGRLNVVCEALLAAADANIEMPQLYERCLAHLSSALSELSLTDCEDPLSVMEQSHLWPRNVVTSAWSFCVMGYNSDPRFKVLLDLLGLPCVYEYPHQSSVVLMALEAAESTLVSGNWAGECEALLETYGDRMRDLERTDPASTLHDVDPEDSMRDHVDARMTFAQCQDAHFHKGRMRATKHISDILYHLGRRDVLVRVAPHYNSPYLIDVCLSNESKKGMVLFSGRELMRDHVEGKWSVVETGSTRLKRSILASTGWQVFEISCGEWAQLQTSVERKQFVRAALSALDIEC